MRRCAAIFEKDPVTGKEEWRIINDPTIGDIHNLRNRGAIIMHQTIQKFGNEIHRAWVTDSGKSVVESIEFLPCRCRCNHE